MTTYATAGDLKSTLSLQGDSFADPDIALAISAASRGIDKVTHRRFYADANATQVRYYTPTSRRLVVIDDLVTLTSLQTGPGDNTFPTTLTLHSQFEMEPLNAAADARPWTKLRAVSASFPAARRSVKVTGKFGWAAVPDEITQATTLLASKLVKRAREAPFGVVIGFGDGGEVARIARMDPDVAMLVGPYVRPLVR